MTYNSERFIARSLDSCLAQTFQDFEICIADDASSDRTVEIIRQYQASNPGRIKLHVQPINMGRYSLAINGNAGRAMCEGEYLAILDGDECMLPDRLEKQVAFLDSYPECIAVSHDKRHVDFESGDPVVMRDKKITKEFSTTSLILHGNSFHNCYMMRNNRMMANESLKVMADWEFIIRLSMLGKLGYQNEELTLKYWHDENVSRTRMEQIALDGILTLAIIEHSYPQFLSEIETRRTLAYLAALKRGDKRYLRALTFRPLSVVRALIAKYF
jgi:glycosyltransferase involved in cell wall biosynthesis